MVVHAVPEGEYADVGGGISMHYHDSGPGPEGAVLFVHGSGPGASGWSNFKGNYPFLAEHGYRTIVPDTMGYRDRLEHCCWLMRPFLSPK